MTTVDMQDVQDRYEARFGNFEDVFHISLASEDRFFQLLEGALTRGRPLTVAEIEAAFGPIDWEE